MDVSIFLARLFGVYMLIISFILATHQEQLIQNIRELLKQPGQQMLIGIINLFGGLAILIGHPIWGFHWAFVITLLGLIMLIKGLLHLICPKLSAQWVNRLLQKKELFTWMLAINVVLGIFLTINGFIH